MVTMRNAQGNILFLILIAVALFAALSYAITYSSRSGDGNIAKDQAKLEASVILQYAVQLEQTAAKLKVVNKCQDNKYSFQNNSVANYENPYAVGTKCHFFEGEGGGLSWRSISEKARDKNFVGQTGYGEPLFTSELCNPNIGTARNPCWNSGLSTDRPLAVVFPYIKAEVCEALNKKLGIPADGAAPVWVDENGIARNTKFQGDYLSVNKPTPDAATSYPVWINVYGKYAYCAKIGNSDPDWAAGSHQFVYIILAR